MAKGVPSMLHEQRSISTAVLLTPAFLLASAVLIPCRPVILYMAALHTCLPFLPALPCLSSLLTCIARLLGCRTYLSYMTAYLSDLPACNIWLPCFFSLSECLAALPACLHICLNPYLPNKPASPACLCLPTSICLRCLACLPNIRANHTRLS